MPEGREPALKVEMDVDGYDLHNIAARRRPEHVCKPGAVHADDDARVRVQRGLPRDAGYALRHSCLVWDAVTSYGSLHLLGHGVPLVLEEEHLVIGGEGALGRVCDERDA